MLTVRNDFMGKISLHIFEHIWSNIIMMHISTFSENIIKKKKLFFNLLAYNCISFIDQMFKKYYTY